jgi:hypothetical protein
MTPKSHQLAQFENTQDKVEGRQQYTQHIDIATATVINDE